LVPFLPLFFDFPISRQDTAPHPAGYRYDQTDEEVEWRKYSHQKHYQPHQRNKADVSNLGIFRHVTTSCYFMLPILQVSVHIIHYACCYLFLPPEENTQAREENAGLVVVATIIVQLRNWWRSLII
jgi:hypothetical protein